MTEREYQRIKELWNKGVSAKRIAYETGYSKHYIYLIASRNRGSFLPRNNRGRKCSEEEKAEYAARINSGESTLISVARETGCSRMTVRKWVRQYAK